MPIEAILTDKDLHFRNKVAGIYIIEHVKSKRRYVGSSVNLYKRMMKHKSDLRARKHHSSKLQNAWNSHGESAFSFFVVEVVTDIDSMLSLEQTWLDEIGPFYNICATAGNRLGYKASDETKAKQSAALKGKSKSAEHRQKLSDTRKANPIPISEENRKALNAALVGVKKIQRSKGHIWKIAAANRGKVRSLEAREKCRDAMMGFKRTDETRRKMSNAAKNRSLRHRLKLGAAKAKSYVVISPDGERFEVLNMREFCRNHPGLRQSSMCAVAAGKQGSHKGWKCEKAISDNLPMPDH